MTVTLRQILPPPTSLWGALTLGFTYWVAFDLALEPGNLAQAFRLGGPIAWDQELLRITGAGLLGAGAAPLVFRLTRRFPMHGGSGWRRGLLHVMASGALSVGLIVVSCMLADQWLAAERRPFLLAMRDQLTHQTLPVAFAMLGFIAIAHLLIPARATEPKTAPRWRTSVEVRTREGVLFVGMAQVDWVETQGNYLALHVGAKTHLLRAAAKRFEAEIDPDRFVRVHRRAIVAIDRVRAVRPLASGDATVQLDTDAQLRVSRVHRQRLMACLKSR
jgi:hypothetical protein